MVPTGHCTKLIIRTKNMKYFIKLTGMEYSLVTLSREDTAGGARGLGKNFFCTCAM